MAARSSLQTASPLYGGDVGPTDALLAVCPDKEVMCEGLHSVRYEPYTIHYSMISCALSCIGSIAIILTFLCWKDIRSGSRTIITYLSIADFLTAAGYLMGSINFLIFRQASEQHGEVAVAACQRFDSICQIQAFISSYSSMSSFIWTSVLAFYLFWTVVKGEVRIVNRLFPLYHLLAWGLPVVIMLPLLIASRLGYSPIAASGWCYIRTDQLTSSEGDETKNKLSLENIALIFVGGKAVEIGTYAIVITLYLGVWCSIRREKKQLSSSSVQRHTGIKQLLHKVELKLYAIPIFFIVLRIWGTLQFFFSIAVFAKGGFYKDGCVSTPVYVVYFILAILQAIGDGGQGWANGVLYVLFSPKIRERLICQPLYCCCDQVMAYYDTFGHQVNHNEQHSSSLTVMESSMNNDPSDPHSMSMHNMSDTERAPLLGQPNEH